MKVYTLMENTCLDERFLCGHGLSLYIEAAGHRILMDMGPDEAYIHNAKALGIDLQAVDIAILSHGHYDHGGGLEAFLKINKKAKIYIGPGAFAPHLADRGQVDYTFIGVGPDLYDDERFVTIDQVMAIDGSLMLFNKASGKRFIPEGNKHLYTRDSEGQVCPDDFGHEINLIIQTDYRCHLFCGCAHRGIVNIIEQAEKLCNQPLDTVIGGFHLRRNHLEVSDEKAVVDGVIHELQHMKCHFYTGHCTGQAIYEYMASQIELMDSIKSGTCINIE